MKPHLNKYLGQDWCEKIKNVSVRVNNIAVTVVDNEIKLNHFMAGIMEKSVRTDNNGACIVENRLGTNNISAPSVEKGFSTVDVE